jgi:hypothetical protein
MREWQRITLILVLCLGLTLSAWTPTAGTGLRQKTANPLGPSEDPQRTTTEVFFDDFDGTDLSSDWEIVAGGGTYTVSGGSLRIYQSLTRLMINTISDYAVDAPANISCRVRASGQGMGSPNFVKLHRYGSTGNVEVTKAWWLHTISNTARMRNVNEGGADNSGNIAMEDITDWHIYRIEWTESSTSLYQDDVLKATLNSRVPDEPLVPAFWSAEGTVTSLYMEIDWVRLEALSDGETTTPGTPSGWGPFDLAESFALMLIVAGVAAIVIIIIIVILVVYRRSVEAPHDIRTYPERFCRECGMIAKETDTYCKRCGAKLR